jgi:hypothetical protein
MLQIQGRIQERMNRDVSMIRLFEYPTIRALAGHLSGDRAATSGGRAVQDRAGRQLRAFAAQREQHQARSKP